MHCALFPAALISILPIQSSEEHIGVPQNFSKIAVIILSIFAAPNGERYYSPMGFLRELVLCFRLCKTPGNYPGEIASTHLTQPLRLI